MRFIKQAAINEFLHYRKLESYLTDYEYEFGHISPSKEYKQIERSRERFRMLCAFYRLFNSNISIEGEIMANYLKPREEDGTLPDFI